MEKIRIGILNNTHGIKGEVKVIVTSEFVEERFAKGNKIYIGNHEEPFEIQYMKYTQKGLIVKFKNYDNINDVECFKGSDLYISIDDVHELEEDEMYYFELKKCKVYDENHEYLGEVSEVIDTLAHAILRVVGEREYLIPYVDAFIVDVHADTHEIIIRMMEGL